MLTLLLAASAVLSPTDSPTVRSADPPAAAVPADRPANAQTEAIVRALLNRTAVLTGRPELVVGDPSPGRGEVDREVAVTDRAEPIYPVVPPAAGAARSPGGPPAGADARRPDPAVPVYAVQPRPFPDRPSLSDAEYRDVLLDLRLPNGLVLDRDSDRHTVSAAATGLVSYALAVLADRGVGDRRDVEMHLRNAFDATLAANPAENRGWLSHFTGPSGEPKRFSEVSTIDTALFYAGVLRAAEVLGLTDLEARVRDAVASVDVPWMLRDGVFLHGLTWETPPRPGVEPRFLPYTWNDTSEGVILYRLFGVPFRPGTHRTDLPLFTYFYPLVLWPDWEAPGSGRPGGVGWGEPAGAPPFRYVGPDYRKLLAAALKWQHATLGHAGVTAADGPGGYTAFRPTLVSPLMLSSLAPKYAEAADTLRDHDLDATQAAYDLDAGWDAPDRLAIDYASYFLLRAVFVEPGLSTPMLAEVD